MSRVVSVRPGTSWAGADVRRTTTPERDTSPKFGEAYTQLGVVRSNMDSRCLHAAQARRGKK